jgi:DNA-binding response OmpR family regulator
MIRKLSILLVEDDENLGVLIKEGLKDEGYTVLWEKTGNQSFVKFKEEQPALAILDVMLPDIDGFELAQKIRKIDKQCPLLFLTARGLPEDRIKGFESGGDDYITKPFMMKELLLRMDVFLKRSGSQVLENDSLEGEGWKLDAQSMVLVLRGKPNKLTQREFHLLKFLIQNQSRLIPREEILLNLWGDDDYFMGRSLDVFISRLRNILKGGKEISIHNEHGIGFRLEINPPGK